MDTLDMTVERIINHYIPMMSDTEKYIKFLNMK